MSERTTVIPRAHHTEISVVNNVIVINQTIDGEDTSIYIPACFADDICHEIEIRKEEILGE